MTPYRCFVWVTPEILQEVDRRLAGVDWEPAHVDTERGLVELRGEFGSARAAWDELVRAPLGIDDTTQHRNLVASGDLGMLIPQLMGDGPPPSTGILVGDQPDGGNGHSQDTPPGQSVDKETRITAGTGETAESSIAAGLEALGVPSELWGFLSADAQKALSEIIIRDLYRERAAYARTVRWTFAPDAELLSAGPDETRNELAAKILKTRSGLADHQVNLANEEVELRKQAVALAVQDVELRRQSVEAQKVVIDMLREFVAQIRKWTWLANWGLYFLIATVLFGIAVTVALVWMAWDEKISEWAIPAAIFALALFAISPAVLLLRERPLKGLDEAGWPGTQPPAPTPPGSGGSADDTEAAAGSPASTVSFGQTNQPKAYGPRGRLRT
jgi:hypothetical protein